MDTKLCWIAARFYLHYVVLQTFSKIEGYIKEKLSRKAGSRNLPQKQYSIEMLILSNAGKESNLFLETNYVENKLGWIVRNEMAPTENHDVAIVYTQMRTLINPPKEP